MICEQCENKNCFINNRDDCGLHEVMEKEERKVIDYAFKKRKQSESNKSEHKNRNEAW